MEGGFHLLINIKPHGIVSGFLVSKEMFLKYNLTLRFKNTVLKLVFSIMKYVLYG